MRERERGPTRSAACGQGQDVPAGGVEGEGPPGKGQVRGHDVLHHLLQHGVQRLVEDLKDLGAMFWNVCIQIKYHGILDLFLFKLNFLFF